MFLNYIFKNTKCIGITDKSFYRIINPYFIHLNVRSNILIKLSLLNKIFSYVWKYLNQITSNIIFLRLRVIFYRTPSRHTKLVYAYLAKTCADWNSGNWVSSLFRRAITWHSFKIVKNNKKSFENSVGF